MVSQIVVFREKHGDRYFDASTAELKALSFLTVLRERVEEGYWYYRQYEQPTLKLSSEQKALLALTDEQLAGLPTAMQNDIHGKRARIERSQQGYLRQKKLEEEWFNAVDVLLSLPDEDAIILTGEDVPGRWGRASLVQEVMSARADYEYEGFDIQPVR